MSERDIFLAAVDLPAGERAAYLDRACGADAGLRARVDGLLGSHEGAGSFLDEPAADPADAATVAFTPTTEPEDDGEVPLGFLDPPGRPDSLGRVGHYDVLEVLGRGGFGVVFRAFDDTLQRVVAVKVLAPQMATTSPARKRFLREARSTAAVRHENVVQVHEVKEHPLPYLVMDYIPGETLQQRVRRFGPLELAEVVRIGRQVAAGLAAAHATGLIHRDIKPSNILLDAGPHPVAKITDFGLARAADDASLTRSGTVAGTPMYMSPEQARGDALDHRSDLFSLGSVLYALVTGRPPFRAETTLAVLKRVAEDTPRPIREVIPEVPGWFCRIVEKLHAKDPAERFQTAAEVADLLADCERQLADGNRLTDTSRIPGGRPKGEPARRPWAALAAAVVLVPLLTWGVYALIRPHTPTPDPVTAGPEVPRTAAEFLPFVRGTWSRDGEIVEPKAEARRVGGQLTFDAVAGGAVLRGLAVDEHAVPTSLVLHRYDPATGRLSSWYFGPNGVATASDFGTYDPATRLFTWLEKLPDGGQSVHNMTVVDGNTVQARHSDTDAKGEFVFDARGTFTRSNLPPVVLKAATDPTRPAEMKVLDRMVGEWQNEQTVTAAAADRPKRETFRVKAEAILGGRFVEEQVTNDTTGGRDYSLSWFDAGAKRYRRWYFSGGGPVSELTGSWDAAAKAITWTSADKGTVVVETFKGDDLSEFRITYKDGDDRAVKEAVGVSRRVATEAAPKAAVMPFDESEAKAHQEAWARHVGEKAEFADRTLGMRFRVIPPGEFRMGVADAEVRDDIERAKKGQHQASKFMVRALEAGLPQHPVRVTRPFAIGKYEVTVGQFRKFVDSGYRPTGPDGGACGLVNGELVKGKEYAWDQVGYEQSDLHPVWNVSAEDAAEFCKWLGEKDGRTYRLPTEAEWEWACRAGSPGPTFFPPKDVHEYAALRAKTARKTEPVGGRRKANPFGLHDTCGNVWEWCSDWYGEGYYKTLAADAFTDDPTGPPGPGKASGKTTHRVQRGGSAFLTAGHATNSNGRGFGEQEGCGFRVVCELVPK